MTEIRPTMENLNDPYVLQLIEALSRRDDVRKIQVEIPYEMEDAIVVAALEAIINENQHELTHPDDKKDYKRWKKAAKVLLPYFKAPGEIL